MSQFLTSLGLKFLTVNTVPPVQMKSSAPLPFAGNKAVKLLQSGLLFLFFEGFFFV